LPTQNIESRQGKFLMQVACLHPMPLHKNQTLVMNAVTVSIALGEITPFKIASVSFCALTSFQAIYTTGKAFLIKLLVNL
jgi:hypothetical protein